MPSEPLGATPPGSAAQQYETLLASIDGIVWEADAATFQFSFVSKQAERLLGYPVDAWLEPGFWTSHLHPSDSDWVQEFCKRATREKRSHDFEYRMIAADGRTVWLRDMVTVIVENGEPSTLRGIMVDITSHKTAAAALQEREAELELALDAGRLGAWNWDLFTGRVTWSAFCKALYGLPEDADVTYELFLARVHPDDRHRVETALRRSVETGADYEIEKRVVWPDGSVHWNTARGRVFVNGEGQPIRMTGVTMDISGRKRAELERREHLRLLENTLRSLRESEGRLEDAQRIAHVGYWQRDYDADRVILSHEAHRIFGLADLDATFTVPVWQEVWLTAIHPDDREHAARAAADALAGVAPYNIDYRIVTPDGGVRFVHSQGDVERNQDGRPRRMFGTVQDITERKLAERALQQLEEQFRQAQKMEAVGRLAGGVAHDFNNLLTVINGCVELVFGRLTGDDPSRELLAEVQKAGERAATLTRQLLAFSRKQVLQPKVLNVNAVLNDLHKLLERLIGEDVELELSLDPALRLSKIDPAQFEQAVINLAINARDAMPHGGRLVIETQNVELDRQSSERHADAKAGPYVLVSVSDSGQGMDAETKAQIFEPFFTTKEAGKGTGLGLAMVYGFVMQSGGQVEVQSEPGKGATFKVFLPSARETAPSVRPRDAKVTIPKGTETVLLVEDEEAVRTVSKLVLQSNGYTVLEARDGHEAVWVAQQHVGPIHIVLTDVVMPRMSGHDLARVMAQARPSSRILFMSGYSHEVVSRHDGADRGIEFLQKPFSPMTLARKVRDVLDSSG